MHDVRAPIERGSIETAVRHRRVGFAWAGAIVAVALVLSICALLMVMSANAAFAALHWRSGPDGPRLGAFRAIAHSAELISARTLAFAAREPLT
jgi:hypothetical protein